jgi:hypothetical protein
MLGVSSRRLDEKKPPDSTALAGAYKTNAALMDLFLDEEFPGVSRLCWVAVPGAHDQVDFAGVVQEELLRDHDPRYVLCPTSWTESLHLVAVSAEEIFTWISGPLLAGAYPSESYNGRSLSAVEQQYVLGYFRLVGGIQLRQVRVTNSSCNARRYVSTCSNVEVDPVGQTSRPGSSCIGKFDNMDGTCFAEFRGRSLFGLQESTEATEPFERNGHWYNWSSQLSPLDGLYGWGNIYGTGGYVVAIPDNHTDAGPTIAQLIQDEWLDRATRAVAVDFNLYNTNTRLVTVVRIVFEMFPSGHMLKWARFYSMPAMPYSGVQDGIRAVFEAIFVLFIVYFLQKAIRRIYRSITAKINIFRAVADPATLFDLVLVALVIIMIQQWARFVLSSDMQTFDVNNPNFVDLYDEAEGFIMVLSWAGLVCLAASFRLFQFMSISKKMSTMWLTLSQGFVDLIAFAVSFCIVIAGFALWGELSFGFFLVDFRTFWAATSALARFTLGAWDYAQLRQARPAFAGVFFSLYSALMTISLLNMIIGIIETSFSEVIDRVENADRWKENSQPAENGCVERVRVMFGICVRRTFGVTSLWADGGDVRMERVIAGQDRFAAALKQCMRKAKKEGHDLFAHFETVYEEGNKDDSLYVSWHEMASLLYKDRTFNQSAIYFKGKPCPEGPAKPEAPHPPKTNRAWEEMVAEVVREAEQEVLTQAEMTVLFDDNVDDEVDAEYVSDCLSFLCCLCKTGTVSPGRPNCCWSRGCRGPPKKKASTSRRSVSDARDSWGELRRLVKAYISLKRVYMVPRARRHRRAKEIQDARGVAPFAVRKKIHGRYHSRYLVLDDQRGELLNFDHRDMLRKRLPLTQLVAVEQNPSSNRSISLVFTSQGVPAEAEARVGGLETVFDVHFARHAEAKRFYTELVQVTNKLHERLRAISEMMVQNPAEAAMMLARAGITAAHATVSRLAQAASSRRLRRSMSQASFDGKSIGMVSGAGMRRASSARHTLRSVARAVSLAKKWHGSVAKQPATAGSEGVPDGTDRRATMPPSTTNHTGSSAKARMASLLAKKLASSAQPADAKPPTGSSEPPIDFFGGSG